MISLASCRGGVVVGAVGLLMLIQIQGDSQETTWAILIFTPSQHGCACLVVCVCSQSFLQRAKYDCFGFVAIAASTCHSSQTELGSNDSLRRGEVGCNHVALLISLDVCRLFSSPETLERSGVKALSKQMKERSVVGLEP